MIRNSVTLLQYSGYLLVIGLASAFYNAANGEVGFNKHGVTGLYACGGSAILIFLFGWLTGKGKDWAAWAGLGLAFMLMSFGGYKLFTLMKGLDLNVAELVKQRAAAGEILTDEAAKNSILYRAGIFGALFFFSMWTFLKLGTALRRSKTT